MYSAVVLCVAVLAALSAAQSTTNDLPYTIDPISVPLATRQYWCEQNQAQCPLICLQQPGVQSETTENNDCDASSLTYTCVCDNGVSPNITQYSQTLPFFICQEWGNQCVAACNNISQCADDCRAKHPCGAQNPYKGNNQTANATAKPTTSSSTVPRIGLGSASSKPNNNSGASPSFLPFAGTGMAIVGSIVFGLAMLL